MLDANETATDTNLEMTVDDDNNKTENGKTESSHGKSERIQKHMSLKVNAINSCGHPPIYIYVHFSSKHRSHAR